MKEYLRSDGDTLTIEYQGNSSTTAVVFNVFDLNLNEYIQSDEATEITGDVFEIVLSQDTTKYDRDLKVELQVVETNHYYEDTLYVKLTRPYATAEEIAEALDIEIDETPTLSNQYKRSTLERLERKARAFIESKINDSFSFEYKTVGTYGMNTDLLHLGNRIESFDQIIFDDYVVYDTTTDPEVNELGQNIAISKSKHGLKVVSEGTNIAEWVDVNPLAFPGYWNKDSAYLVRGEFGWQFVPSAIKEATLELINDMMCSDFNYRNKGIKSIKNDAFDVQFQDSVILGTGNVMVDALISPYKKFELKAI